MANWLNPASFEQAVILFLIPVGTLCLAWLLQRHAKGQMNAAVDLFVFITALDFAYLARSERAASRINPQFAPFYSPLFAAMLVVALVMLAFAARVQAAIHQHAHGKQEFYPGGKVAICWLFALAMIGFHLLVTVGGW